jgi:hypothetical protein
MVGFNFWLQLSILKLVVHVCDVGGALFRVFQKRTGKLRTVLIRSGVILRNPERNLRCNGVKRYFEKILESENTKG